MSEQSLEKRITWQVSCGGVLIGGGAPVSIQSMTNTDPHDACACIEQVQRLKEAGCQIVRLTVPDEEAAKVFGEVKKVADIPLVADIHFDYRMALLAIENGADKIRINPGNIGGPERIKAVVDAAKERGIPIRVGVNSGSLEKEIKEKHGGVTAGALVESALKNAALLEEYDFHDIVISIKSSDVKMNTEAYRMMAEACHYPLHIGVTEAGSNRAGMIKSAVGLGALLMDGIGDTMRVSLTGDPVQEVFAAREILAAAGRGLKALDIVSCPTCGRTKVDLSAIAEEVESRLYAVAQRRFETEGKTFKVAVMGCEVNGPGEAGGADFGVACGKGKGLIFVKGSPLKTVNEEDIVKELLVLAESI